MGPRNGRYKPFFFLHWGQKGQKALPHVATLGSAGGGGQNGGRGDGGDGGDGCVSGGPLNSTVEAVVTVPGRPRPCRGLTEPGRDEEHLLEARQPRGSSSHSTCYRSEQPQLVLVRMHGCSPPPARGEKALKFRCKKLQKTLRRRGEGNAAGSYLMRTAVRAWREPGGLRFWAALGLQRALLELPFVGLGQQAGHLCAACRSGSTS